MYKIGFLGLGKMGSSILNGILSKGLYSKSDISFYAPSESTKKKGTDLGINLSSNERDLLLSSNLIVLAIEPQKYEYVFRLAEDIDFIDKTIVSLAPGKDIALLKGAFKNASVVRVMPNTPCLVGKGMTTIAFDKQVNQEVLDIFSSIGTYQIVEEEMIDVMIPLQGSMPAYLFEFVKAFVSSASSYDIDENTARKIALEAIIGSCELAKNSDKSLDELIDSVCSPGGATIEGIKALRDNDFSDIVDKCYKACVNRGKELKGC